MTATVGGISISLSTAADICPLPEDGGHDDVAPEARHGLMEALLVCASAVQYILLDAALHEPTALIVSVSAQEYPRQPQVCVVVPHIQAAGGQLQQERFLWLVVSLQERSDGGYTDLLSRSIVRAGRQIVIVREIRQDATESSSTIPASLLR